MIAVNDFNFVFRRIREKYENEIRDLEISEKECKIRYGEMKMTLLETENEIILLRNTIKQLEQQLKESHEVRIAKFLIYLG